MAVTFSIVLNELEYSSIPIPEGLVPVQDTSMSDTRFPSFPESTIAVPLVRTASPCTVLPPEAMVRTVPPKLVPSNSTMGVST